MTRQPDDDERGQGISGERAREIEAEFFNTHSPWSTSTEPGRFGTRNLTATLSRLLTEIINESYVYHFFRPGTFLISFD